MLGLFKVFARLFRGGAKPVLEIAPEAETEFLAEVVEIAEVLPHPDPTTTRLEIVHLRGKGGALAYTCVVGKGEWSVGQPAAYLSVDCIVPTNLPEFEFLKQRKDGAGKDRYRLRAARLRGVYSEGLVVAAPRGAQLGDSVKDTFQVEYHNPDPAQGISSGPSPRRPKKDWRRNKIPEYGVVSLRKAPFMFTPGELVVVTEKIHGTNFRFGWVRHNGRLQWVIGSHRTFKTDNRGWFARMFGKEPGPGGYGEDLWSKVAELYNLREEARHAPGIVFYGEVYGFTPDGKAIQDLTYGAQGPEVRLFDALDTVTGHWLDRRTVGGLAFHMGVGIVPVLHDGIYDPAHIAKIAEEPSRIDGGIREGVVVESKDGERRKGKWVSEQYRMRKGG